MRSLVLAIVCLVFAGIVQGQEPKVRIATFVADVTPPIGHPCMGGGIEPVKVIDDPLYAHGLVFLSDAKPVVVVAIDWCEIRNDAYERWREALAIAAGTDKVRVLVTALHQHDAPIADLTAQKLLDRHKARGRIVDLDFHEKAVQRVARALSKSLTNPQAITHVGTSQAQVKDVASNRRTLDEQGKPRHNRMSRTTDPILRDRPEGTIDPWLKTLSFWNGDIPVAALSVYATHPMSYYGQGRTTSDFVGLARKRRQADTPGVFQLYASGCSGNVTAGKYNAGRDSDRGLLTDRIYQGMAESWKKIMRQPIVALGFQSTTIDLKPRTGGLFDRDALRKRLTDPPPTTDPLGFRQCLAAFGLSWRERLDAGIPIELPALDFGPAQLLILPAESYVEYQLAAQALRPDSFVVVMGYGESAPGDIPTQQALDEDDSNLHDWCWVAPGAEAAMRGALARVLKK